MPDVSIITCTYNPSEEILKRVLVSIETQVLNGIKFEYVIVDNNSQRPVIELQCVKAFLERNKWAKVISEKKQGLSYARVAGIRATTGSVVIFVDDDNELNKNYIQNAIRLMNEQNCLGILGPGIITVEFVGNAEKIVSERLRYMFLEKKAEGAIHTFEAKYWHDAYPPGAGQTIRRDVLEKYANLFEGGVISATDRKGRSLSSSGDAQIIWTAIKSGYAVGISPELSLNHLISEKRATFKHLVKLSYGLSNSHFPAFVEIFPEEISKIRVPALHHIAIKTLKCFLKSILDRDLRLFNLYMSYYLGEVSARQKVTGIEKHKWLDKVAKLIGAF